MLQTVQKNNRQFTYGQTVQKNNNNLHMDRQCKKKQQQFTYGQYIFTDCTEDNVQNTVENFVLLKCRNSEEKTRRLRIGLSAEFLYSMTCVVICSHRRSHLKSFLQGIFIVRIGGGTFLG